MGRVKPINTNLPPVDWSYLLVEAPKILWRHRWNEYTEKLGLPYKRGTMQNLDSKGLGPRKVTHGARVGYLREDLVAWLVEDGREKR